MKYKLKFIPDALGTDYLAVKFDKDDKIITYYLDILKKYLGDDYERYTEKQKERDRGDYHITAINVPEISKIMKDVDLYEKLLTLENYEINDIKTKGIGVARNDKSESYFIVVNSDTIDEIRKMYNLPNRDLHITLAFSSTDVFGLPKDETSLVNLDNSFIKKFKEDYKNYNSLEFFKTVENYNLDKSLDIKTVEIKNNTGTFHLKEIGKCFSVILDEQNNYLINSIWSETNDVITMPKNILDKKLNK